MVSFKLDSNVLFLGNGENKLLPFVSMFEFEKCYKNFNLCYFYVTDVTIYDNIYYSFRVVSKGFNVGSLYIRKV